LILQLFFRPDSRRGRILWLWLTSHATGVGSPPTSVYGTGLGKECLLSSDACRIYVMRPSPVGVSDVTMMCLRTGVLTHPVHYASYTVLPCASPGGSSSVPSASWRIASFGIAIPCGADFRLCVGNHIFCYRQFSLL